MAVSAGLDLLRGRPTPAIGTTEAKLQQRKLDALKRGVHRIKTVEALPYGVHMIGIGGAGTAMLRHSLEEAPDGLLDVEGSRLTGLALDFDRPALDAVELAAQKFRGDRTHIETLALSIPAPHDLLESLARYPDALRLESPMARWNDRFQPWIGPEAIRTEAGGVSRALAKAIYGRAYYDGDRPAFASLKRFAASIEATKGDAVVCILFGLGGGTGSGIALDLARHLSNAILGRRVLVAGIGVLPCDGDPLDQRGARLFPVLSELDCMGDEAKNRGVVMSCGDLYRNPFTAGFIAVPQQHVWNHTHDLDATHARVGREIAALLTRRQGANLWEMLRLLNWVAAPSTQHSAARTPWGEKWLHLLGFADAIGGPMTVTPQLPAQLGLRPGYRPEFIEMRVPQDAEMLLAGADAIDTQAASLADRLDEVFAPDVPPQVQFGAPEGSVQFVLPRIAKTELALFETARDAYDAATPDRQYHEHSLLLEQGVQLCEASTVLPGMAGASLWGGSAWIAVPLADLRQDHPDHAAQPEQTSNAA